MIDHRDTSWDDAGFDDDNSFRRAAQQQKPSSVTSEKGTGDSSLRTTESASEQTQGQAQQAQSEPRRQAVVIPPPPAYRSSDRETEKDSRRRRLSTFLITLALLTIIIAGGYIISTLFLPDETETALFVDTGDGTSNTGTVQSTKPAVNNDTLQTTLEPPTETTPTNKAPQTPVMSPQQPKQSASSRAEWVVQVFSSPSRDDAAEWLQTLQRKSVADGYIIEHDVRGTTWYRVRFGQFATREEAESAAIEAGVQQPWIARVR